LHRGKGIAILKELLSVSLHSRIPKTGQRRTNSAPFFFLLLGAFCMQFQPSPAIFVQRSYAFSKPAKHKFHNEDFVFHVNRSRLGKYTIASLINTLFTSCAISHLLLEKDTGITLLRHAHNIKKSNNIRQHQTTTTPATITTTKTHIEQKRTTNSTTHHGFI
jgi:hypothetical protein